MKTRKEWDTTRYYRQKALVSIYEQVTGQDKCVICGTAEKLEWDHVDPSTKVKRISGLIGNRSMKTIHSELAKCQRLCKPCHSKKTLKENKANPRCRMSKGRPRKSD